MQYIKRLLIVAATVMLLPFSYAFAAAKLPIVVESDHLTYSETNGAVTANGNVVITNDKDKITAAAMRGNIKENMVWIDDSAHFSLPNVNMEGKGIQYNYRERAGSITDARGVIEGEQENKPWRMDDVPGVQNNINKQYISGKRIVLDPKQMQLSDGSITSCDAEEPHYHVSAEKIEIWPGDKMIAYNAKLWIGNTVILSLPKYESSLVKDNSTVSAFPRIGYNSTNGFMLAQYMELPVSKQVSLFTDAVYYTKDGFKPVYGLVSDQSWFTAKLYRGDEQNGDHEWIKKEAQFDLQFKPYRLQDTSWTANVFLGAGKWTQGDIKGWRQDYKLYFSKDPLKLSDKWMVTTGAGFERVNYGYNQTSNNIWQLDIALIGHLNDRWNVWTSYDYNHQTGKSVYDYDNIDVAKELTTGFLYRVDKKNAVGVETVFNMENNTVKDVDYTWRHNMHCWDTSITYRAKRDQVNFQVSLGAW